MPAASSAAIYSSTKRARCASVMRSMGPRAAPAVQQLPGPDDNRRLWHRGGRGPRPGAGAGGRGGCRAPAVLAGRAGGVPGGRGAPPQPRPGAGGVVAPALGRVRAFVAVVDHGRFGRAAQSLTLTQRALSKRVARLEGTLGPLLERHAGGVALTPAGERFLPARGGCSRRRTR